ncbi:dynein light chain Tctex-type 5-B-like [Saccostrea echinata]|uniref:dynein light chain Tctex-type 5-B-like n=1 Tax=Saccostrea echinata TaxID=191078 RepID=UPI002A7ED231|nr:dynein light chain Tctex-type 5-B-like [Saccostrea echinata]
MEASEKLTIQALKAHDKVHPKFKSAGRNLKQKSRASLLSSPEDPNEVKNKQDEGSNSRRSRTLSTSSQSKKSEPPAPRRSGITFFRIVAATRAWQRLAKKKSSQAAAPSKPQVRLENTYQLEPEDDKTFIPKKAEKIIQEIFDSRLQQVKYDSVRSKLLAKDLATVINKKIKDLEIPRYKTVSSVTIVENKGQGLKVVTRCIWNTTTDNYATYTYTNQSLIAIGHVHVVYYE